MQGLRTPPDNWSRNCLITNKTKFYRVYIQSRFYLNEPSMSEMVPTVVPENVISTYDKGSLVSASKTCPLTTVDWLKASIELPSRIPMQVSTSASFRIMLQTTIALAYCLFADFKVYFACVVYLPITEY